MNKEQLNSIYEGIRHSVGSNWSDDDFRDYIDLKQIYKSMFVVDHITSLSDDNINNEKIAKPKINAKLI